jgi:hypothetical protein
VHNIRRSMSIMDQKSQIRRFSEICDPASLLDRSSCEFGLHELCVSAIVFLALFVLRLGEGRRRGSIRSIVDAVAPACARRLISRGAFIDTFAAVAARVSSRTLVTPSASLPI